MAQIRMLLRVYVTHLLLLMEDRRGSGSPRCCLCSFIHPKLPQWAQTPFRLAKRTDPLSPHLWARSWDTWTSCTRSSTPKTGQTKHWTIFNLSLCLLGVFCHRTAAFTNSVTVTSWYWVHHGGTKHWRGLTVCASRCCDSFTISGYRGNLKGSWKIYLRTGRPWQSAAGV